MLDAVSPDGSEQGSFFFGLLLKIVRDVHRDLAWG